MTKNEIVNYVVETPHNVNKRILGQQLDEFQKNVSWNDLKDRPFYSEYADVEILPETTFTNCSPEGVQFAANMALEEGMVCKVVWNGVEYVCETMYVWEYIAYGVGNKAAIGGENTGEPFAIIVTDIGGTFIPLDGSTTVTISITAVNHEAVHKLDTKYLPNGVGDDVIFVIRAADGIVSSESLSLVRGSFGELHRKVDNGDVVHVWLDTRCTLQGRRYGGMYTALFAYNYSSYAVKAVGLAFIESDGRQRNIRCYEDGTFEVWFADSAQ